MLLLGFKESWFSVWGLGTPYEASSSRRHSITASSRLEIRDSGFGVGNLVVGGELVEEAFQHHQLERLLQLLENNLLQGSGFVRQSTVYLRQSNVTLRQSTVTVRQSTVYYASSSERHSSTISSNGCFNCSKMP